MTYSKKWTRAKALQFCEENFIGDDDEEPRKIAEFMDGRKGSMELHGEQGKEVLTIRVESQDE